MLPLASLACSFSFLLRTPPQNQPPCRLVAPSPRISMDILALRAQNLRSPPVHCKFHCKFHSVQYSKLPQNPFSPLIKMKNPSPLNSFLPPLFLLPSPTLHLALNSLSLHLITLIHSLILLSSRDPYVIPSCIRNLIKCFILFSLFNLILY